MSENKIDVIDFIIAVLKEHEKVLDLQISRLEELIKKVEGEKYLD